MTTWAEPAKFKVSDQMHAGGCNFSVFNNKCTCKRNSPELRTADALKSISELLTVLVLIGAENVRRQS